MTPEAQRILHSSLAILCLLLCGPPAAGQNEKNPIGDVGRADPGRTIVLPRAGTYRAPGILRLAGKLHGLPVKVERRELNDEKITVAERFSKRPVTLAELSLLLAAQSFYLHIWNHPEHGELLVVSRQVDWKPVKLRFQKVLKVGARQFDQVWTRVQNYASTLNAGLEPGSPRMVTLSDPRTGKIFLWAPKKSWLENVLQAAEKSINDSQEARERLSTYKVHHHRAATLLEAVLEEFPEQERDRIHLVVAPWGNHLLYRANRELSARILDSLIKLDKPAKKVR